MINSRARVPLLAAMFGAFLPTFVYAIDVYGHTMWGQVVVLALCPSYLMFLGTAACERFDACSVNTLLSVAVINSILYGGTTTVLLALKRRSKSIAWLLGPLCLLEAAWIKWLIVG